MNVKTKLSEEIPIQRIDMNCDHVEYHTIEYSYASPITQNYPQSTITSNFKTHVVSTFKKIVDTDKINEFIENFLLNEINEFSINNCYNYYQYNDREKTDEDNLFDIISDDDKTYKLHDYLVIANEKLLYDFNIGSFYNVKNIIENNNLEYNNFIVLKYLSLNYTMKTKYFYEYTHLDNKKTKINIGAYFDPQEIRNIKFEFLKDIRRKQIQKIKNNKK